MGIRHRLSVTPAMLKTHAKRIALCRGLACLSDLDQVFGTTESNQLERIIDGKTARRNEHGEAQWSRKYVRYAKGSVPDDRTIANAELAAAKLGRCCRLKFWRDHPLWVLLQEPVVSLATIRDIMADLPRIIRKQLYFLDSCNRFGRYERQDFVRNHAIALRDRGTLDALVGLLALAREGEILEDEPKHALPVRCAFEIFPLVVLDNPQLNACWVELYTVLELAFWRREYHSGMSFTFYTLGNVKLGLDAKRRDRSAILKWSAGKPGKMLTDDEWRTLFAKSDTPVQASAAEPE